MEQSTTSPRQSTFHDPLNLSLIDQYPSELDDSLDFLLDSPKRGGTKNDITNSHNNSNSDAVTNAASDRPQCPSPLSETQQQQDQQQMPPPPFLTMNWVHMEVQENAKIPNLYHVPVRRRNGNSSNIVSSSSASQRKRSRDEMENSASSSTATATAATSGITCTSTSVSAMKDEDDTILVDELLRLTDEDWTLTEKFLGNDHRMSAAAAYSNAGALMSSIGTKVESMLKNSEAENSNTDSSDDTGPDCGTNPTEPCRALVNPKVNTTATSSVVASSERLGGVQPNKKEEELNNLHRSYSYGRTFALPIPTKRLSPPTRATKSTPIAIATTLKPMTESSISTATNINESRGQQKCHRQQQQDLSIPTISYPKSMQKSKNLTPSSQPTLERTPPSILEASKKRSQFGFGENHAIPSPVQQPLVRRLPPAAVAANSTKLPKFTQNKTKAKSSTLTRKHKSTGPVTPPTIQEHAKLSTSNGGASYERKKQRAKDARIKLNESIERLSVAINLAGTQSKERAKAHAYWANSNDSKAASTTEYASGAIPLQLTSSTSTSKSASKASPSSPSAESGITSTVTIMEEAVKTADSAKKWERPSFVGSAATMINQLNSQCEALMRELIELKKMQNDGVLSSATGGKNNVKPEDLEIVSMASHSMDDIDKRSHGSGGNCGGSCNSNLSLEQHSKRLNTGHVEHVITINDVIKRDRIIVKIGSFLDPGSILRFMCVSKSWQVQLDPAMKSDSIWSTLCVQRFGVFSVREWLNNQDEEATSSEQVSQIDLYRQMSASNIKPKCHFEGNLRLGGGKIDNVACGWVSAVERSNGETLRSVLTSSGGQLKYMSLPVIELRVLIQNVGIADTEIEIPDQIISIDASTRRRGEEMFEITSDSRMLKKVIRSDGSIVSPVAKGINHMRGNLIKLKLFESAILSVFIHARACSTTTKFRQRANFAKTLLNVRGRTVPLVIPITGPKSL